MKLFSYLKKKGITTDILVIVLLVVGLAIAAILFITFVLKGKAGSSDLFNITNPLKSAAGF